MDYDQSGISILNIDQSQVSMDNESSENWWDTVDLTKLILACNKISSISPKVTINFHIECEWRLILMLSVNVQSVCVLFQFKFSKGQILYLSNFVLVFTFSEPL